MAGDITWVGMDAHKKFINVAVKLPEGEELVEWRVPNEPQQVRRLARKLVRMAVIRDYPCGALRPANER